MSDLTNPVSTPETRPRLLDRTLRNLRSAWRDVAGSTWGAVRRGISRPRPDLPPEDWDAVVQQMRDCLAGRGGEVSARARAAALGRTYLGLDAAGRRNFLLLLNREFGTDPAAVSLAMDEVRAASDPRARAAAERDLRRALEPGRVRLLTQFNALPEGVKFLVELRAELLNLKAEIPELAELEEDLKDLLRSWFDVGFLDLHRITWDSPASLLEKLIAYEAVHTIRSWQDLKNRLDSDRRCFAFFHPRMPGEPLIFVEVALVSGMAGNIQELLDEAAPQVDPRRADSAIFYSISNAQKGLAGISFGSFLIKRVVDWLAGELPNLKTFATLSPIPGFRAWLDEALARSGDALLERGEIDQLSRLARSRGWPDPERPLLARALADPDWPGDAAVAGALKGPLMRLGARYLLLERRGRRAWDPVAHFHLSNGARMERVNFLGDVSPKGLKQSAGLMVNYRYSLTEIARNHEAYTGEGKISAASAVKALVKEAS